MDKLKKMVAKTNVISYDETNAISFGVNDS